MHYAHTHRHATTGLRTKGGVGGAMQRGAQAQAPSAKACQGRWGVSIESLEKLGGLWGLCHRALG